MRDYSIEVKFHSYGEKCNSSLLHLKNQISITKRTDVQEILGKDEIYCHWALSFSENLSCCRPPIPSLNKELIKRTTMFPGR